MAEWRWSSIAPNDPTGNPTRQAWEMDSIASQGQLSALKLSECESGIGTDCNRTRATSPAGCPLLFVASSASSPPGCALALKQGIPLRALLQRTQVACTSLCCLTVNLRFSVMARELGMCPSRPRRLVRAVRGQRSLQQVADEGGVCTVLKIGESAVVKRIRSSRLTG